MTGEDTRGQGKSPHRDNYLHNHHSVSIEQKFKDLDARIDVINTGVNAPVTVDALIKQTEPPFTKRVMKFKLSSRAKLPSQLEVYEVKTDPMDHIDS